MSDDPVEALARRAEQISWLAEVIGQADGWYTDAYGEPAMRVTANDEAFAAIMYDLGARVASNPSVYDGQVAEDTALLDWLDTLPSGIIISGDAAHPQSMGMTPKQPGFSHIRDLIRQAMKMRSGPP